MGSSSVVLVVDGDNVTWRTDAVFRAAQLALLDPFVKAKIISYPNLENLRMIDQALISEQGKSEYDFKLLPRALAHYFQKKTISEAVNAAVNASDLDPELLEVVEEAYQSFKREMKAIPELYSDVVASLQTIRASIGPLVTILFSEGKKERIEQVHTCSRDPYGIIKKR